MRQSIFSASPRILMAAVGIDLVTRRRQEPLLLGGLWGGQGSSALGGDWRPLGWAEPRRAGRRVRLRKLSGVPGVLHSSWTRWGAGTSPRGPPRSTGINTYPPREDRQRDTLVPGPSRCVCLSTLKCIRFTPLSFCDKRICIIFFFKEREIPDLSGLQQIT